MVFETRSDAEREVLEALERQIPTSEYEILSCTEYTAKRDKGGLIEGEIDFLIFSPRQGIIVIEVKGGGIHYDGRQRKWYSYDHLRQKHPINDPFRQASRATHAIRDCLIREGITSQGSEAIPVCHAVIFPDVVWGNNPLPAHAKRDLIIDSFQMRDLKRAIADILKVFRREYHRQLTDDEIEFIRSRILYPTACVMPTLKSQINREQARFVKMTETQKIILDHLEHCKRLGIRGYAGTGKTLLAVEKARRLHHKGLRVAVLCYNKALSEDIKMSLINYSDRIYVGNYHSLCRSLCRKAGVPFNPPKDDDEEMAIEFWHYETPILLLEALGKVDDRYDAIIVDEGQDFREEWFESIESALVDPKNDHFYIFLDPKQTIYYDPAQLPVPLSDFVLRVNCRNTKAISELVKRFGDIEVTPHPDAPVGEEPIFIAYLNRDDELMKIEATISKLLNQDGVEPQDIVCLSTHSKRNSCFCNIYQIAGVPLTEELVANEVGIRFASLHKFKGLEANIVLLCDVTPGDEFCKPEHLYVATSRARHRIFILHHESWHPPPVKT
ncbi:MAG: NERD domain-containing protein [bacterium]